MLKRRLRVKFINILSYLRHARFIWPLFVFISQFFLNDLQANQDRHPITKYLIDNIFDPYKDCGWVLLGIAGALWIISVIGIWAKWSIDKNKCDICTQDLESDYKWRLSQELKQILEELELNFPTQRISVYKHDKENKLFNLIGRYSSNPEIPKEGGRPSYPDTEGAIREAWVNGEAVIEIVNDPTQNLDGYCRELLEKWKIPLEVSRNLNMKSVYYSAHAISNFWGERIAVVIWESTQKIQATQ